MRLIHFFTCILHWKVFENYPNTLGDSFPILQKKISENQQEKFRMYKIHSAWAWLIYLSSNSNQITLGKWKFNFQSVPNVEVKIIYSKRSTENETKKSFWYHNRCLIISYEDLFHFQNFVIAPTIRIFQTLRPGEEWMESYIR